MLIVKRWLKAENSLDTTRSGAIQKKRGMLVSSVVTIWSQTGAVLRLNLSCQLVKKRIVVGGKEMISVSEDIEQSVSIVECLLVNSFPEKSPAPRVETQSFEPDFESEFNTRGAARVEILFDTMTTAKKSNTLEIHGLVENAYEERVPLVFFCETEWLNSEKAENRTNGDGQNQKSFVFDFPMNSHNFSSANFSVVFKNASDGEILGKGNGYLRFEKMGAMNQA